MTTARFSGAPLRGSPGPSGPDVGRRELGDWATRELAAAGCVSARAEADWLLEEAVDEESLRAMVARRVAGEPLQYVIGWAPFGPLRLAVGPGVFVPRPETEGLADRAATRLRSRPEPAEGSGEPQGGAPVGREGSGEPQGGAPVGGDDPPGPGWWAGQDQVQVQVYEILSAYVRTTSHRPPIGPTTWTAALHIRQPDVHAAVTVLARRTVLAGDPPLDLVGSLLPAARLGSARLAGADLRGADLRGTSLQHAQLAGTNLEESLLCGAQLQGADLAGANLAGARATVATAWPDGFDWRAAGVRLVGSCVGPSRAQPSRAATCPAARSARAITDSIGLTPLAVGNSEASAT